MRHWLQLATRNWRVKPGRTLAIVVAVALGVGTVVAVTSIYASVEATIGEQIVVHWLGRTHISIESPHGHWGGVDQALVDPVRKVAGVEALTTRFKTRMRLRVPDEVPELPRQTYIGEENWLALDVVGIDPRHEYAFRPFDNLEGRRIRPEDRGVVIFEKRLADDLGLSLGDTVAIEPIQGFPPVEVEIVGLIDARRVAIFQKPTVYLHIDDVQEMRNEPGKVSVIDCIVDRAEPERIDEVAEDIRNIIRERRQGFIVTTATTKLRQLRDAQNVTHVVLLLFAFVALLTSFFIIITTMSMGMTERIRILGTLRCVGTTRAQLAALVYTEVLPLGVLGVALGVPIGMGMAQAGASYVPHVDLFVQSIIWSGWGISVAVIGGLITTLAGASAVLIQVARISPLAAVNIDARGSRTSTIVLAAVSGAVLLLINAGMVQYVDPLAWFEPLVAFCGIVTLYAGYMLIAPLLVLLIGGAAVHLAAPPLGVHRRLAQDQVGRAPWRSAGVCWMLMVGLSLIVYFFVRGESITHAWDFPARLAGTFVWSHEPFPASRVDEVRALPRVGEVTPINDVICKIEPKQRTLFSFFKSQSVFAAGEPETFLSMAKLEFIQGNLEDAQRKLARGGYVLLPPEASHSFGYELGDKVPVTIGTRTVEFEVAGVVRSPAMDIAVSYFQADSYMMLASAGSVLGTLDDLERLFNIDTVSMVLMNVELEDVPYPAEFAADQAPPIADRWIVRHLGGWLDALRLDPQRRTALAEQLAVRAEEDPSLPVEKSLRLELERHKRALWTVGRQWEELDPSERWEIYREQLVLEDVKALIERPEAMSGSLRRIKQDIDEDIRKATLIISAVPLISLLVATLGVANLMMVNVNSRARQIAILRSVGSTKSQIARLVLVEAVVLGLLGSAVGILLGMHSAYSTHVLLAQMLGIEIPFVVPWPRIAGAVGLTWLICLLAGIGPALRASRSNVIEALQTT